MKPLCSHRVQKGAVVALSVVPSSKPLSPSPLDPVTTPTLISLVVLLLGLAPRFRRLEPTRRHNFDRSFAARLYRSKAHALAHPWPSLHAIGSSKRGEAHGCRVLHYSPPSDPIEGVDDAHAHLGQLSPGPVLPGKPLPRPSPFEK